MSSTAAATENSTQFWLYANGLQPDTSAEKRKIFPKEETQTKSEKSAHLKSVCTVPRKAEKRNEKTDCNVPVSPEERTEDAFALKQKHLAQILRVISGIANTPVLTVLHKTQSDIIFQCSDILAWCADLIFRRGIQGSYSGLVFCQPGLVFVFPGIRKRYSDASAIVKYEEYEEI
jgi:hypothetical protein